LRISLDSKAKVKIGNLSREGKDGYLEPLKKCVSTLNFDLSVSFGKPYNAGDSEESVKAHLPFAIMLHIV
jgi:hypothetical protein